VLQRHALEIFHGDKRHAILLADVVNGADIGMVQGRGRLCFALEARQSLRIAGHFVRQKLERDETVKPSVFGFVHDAHAAAAKLLNNAVVRDGLTDQQETPSLRVDSSYGRCTCQSTKDGREAGRVGRRITAV
jgi:hypothetical protein